MSLGCPSKGYRTVSTRIQLTRAAGSGGPSFLSMDFRLGGPPQEFPYQSLCSAFNQAQNEQQNNRTDEGVDNRGNKTAPDYNAELRQQPTSDEAADYSDDDIPDKPVTAAFDQHTSKPTGDGTDNKPNNECLNVHLSPHVLARTGYGCLLYPQKWTLRLSREMSA